MTPDEEARVAALERQVRSLTERVNRFEVAGLDALRFQNLFPKSGEGNNGTAQQAARADHAH